MLMSDLLQLLEDAHAALADSPVIESFAARRTLEYVGHRLRTEGVTAPPKPPHPGRSSTPKAGWACQFPRVLRDLGPPDSPAHLARPVPERPAGLAPWEGESLFPPAKGTRP